jgi:hypothetical protein
VSEGTPPPPILMKAKSQLICLPPTTETWRSEARVPPQNTILHSDRRGCSLAKAATTAQGELPPTWTASPPKPRVAETPTPSGNETVYQQGVPPLTIHRCRENQRTKEMAVTCLLLQERTKQREGTRRAKPDGWSHMSGRIQRWYAGMFAFSSTE